MGVRGAATHPPVRGGARPAPHVALLLLCSACYLVGIWQHGGFASPSSPVACTPTPTSPTRTPSSRSHSDSSDFSPHHTAAFDPSASSPAEAPKRFRACPAKYSEYTPCEDVARSLRYPRDRLVYRERHCPVAEELLRCLVPAPPGYRSPFPWPRSRDVAWFANVPHRELTVEKAVQNWIRVDGDKLRFPGGGTMFPHGADAYIDDIGKIIPLLNGSIRTALDTGCGVRTGVLHYTASSLSLLIR
jgi:hypothetical protein